MEEVIQMGSYLLSRGYVEVIFLKGDNHASYFLARSWKEFFDVKIVHEDGGVFFRGFLDSDGKWIHEGTYKGGVEA